MEFLLAVLVYFSLIAISVSLMVWDWTNDGLNVDGEDLGSMIFVSTFGCIFFIFVLGFKFIFHTCTPKLAANLKTKVLFKAKRKL